MKITIKELKTLIKETVKKKQQRLLEQKQQRLLEQKQLKEELFGITESDVNVDTEETVTEGSFKNLALGAALAVGLTGGAIANQTVRSNHNSAVAGAIQRVVSATNSRTSSNDIASFIGADAFATPEEIEKLLVQKLKTQGDRFISLARQSNDVNNIGPALQTLANESLTLTDQEKELVRSYAARLR
jgi:hypothetical protein